MTGFINGTYSKYHCEAPHPSGDGKCLEPAILRWFRDENVPLCGAHYKQLQEIDEAIKE